MSFRIWRPKRFQLIAILVMLLAVAAAFGYTWQFMKSHEELRELTLAEADRRAQQLADAIGDQAELLFRNIDVSLLELREAWLSKTKAFKSTVQSLRSTLPRKVLANVSVISPHGYIVYSAASNQDATYVGDREYFRVHAKSNVDRLHINRPLLGRTVSGWVIFVSRPIFFDEAFAGVVVVGISPAFVSRWIDAVNLLSGGTQRLAS